MAMIPLQKPHITGNEIGYIAEVIETSQLSGNGEFTKRCQRFFESTYSIPKSLLTNSCTSALEMAALLLDIQKDDEIIVPSFTYVSSANPFVIRGANVVFADSEEHSPNLDAEKLPNYISSKTKAIVVVHYAGIACDMDAIMELATTHGIWVIEDAAHAQGAQYKGQFLGTIGQLGAYSFHATKNISSGEGGLLAINEESLIDRAELLWEKGTNRAKFLKGEVPYYEWCDIGSSFYPSEITAAFLWAQLEKVEELNKKRIQLWNRYADGLAGLDGVQIPSVPEYASHNAHLFFVKVRSKAIRETLIKKLMENGIAATFHYMALHRSTFWKNRPSISLPNAQMWEDQILRLPLYYDLTTEEVDFIIKTLCDIIRKHG